ncbi:DNA topoisomerase I [Psidium guajava]|nr:DNA topoisomerase I [Psidium guajava]
MVATSGSCKLRAQTAMGMVSFEATFGHGNRKASSSNGHGYNLCARAAKASRSMSSDHSSHMLGRPICHDSRKFQVQTATAMCFDLERGDY